MLVDGLMAEACRRLAGGRLPNQPDRIALETYAYPTFLFIYHSPLPKTHHTWTEDCYWGHLAGCRTCLVHIGTAHTLEAMRSGYVHNVVESLEELMTIVGHEADDGEEGGDQDGPGAAGAGPS